MTVAYGVKGPLGEENTAAAKRVKVAQKGDEMSVKGNYLGLV